MFYLESMMQYNLTILLMHVIVFFDQSLNGHKNGDYFLPDQSSELLFIHLLMTHGRGSCLKDVDVPFFWGMTTNKTSKA